MMECKDCIHYQACQYHITEETKMTVAECSNFKDKSKFIELPCKVGSKIYAIVEDDEICERQIEKIEIYVGGTYYFDVNDNMFTKWDIGKTIFLTCEEAEEALKEREKE